MNDFREVNSRKFSEEQVSESCKRNCFADALRGIGASNSSEENRNAESRGCAAFEKRDGKKRHIFSPAKDEETSRNYRALLPPNAKKEPRTTAALFSREGGAAQIYRGFLPRNAKEETLRTDAAFFREARRNNLPRLPWPFSVKREEETLRNYRGVLPRNAKPAISRLRPAKRQETSHNYRGFFP